MDNSCDCCCHHGHDDDMDGLTPGYRVMMGKRREGYSIREVLYDDKKKIVAWNPEPVADHEESIDDIKSYLVMEMQEIDEMLEATKRPVLDEALLEAGLRKRKK